MFIGEMALPGSLVRRQITRLLDDRHDGWQIDDLVEFDDRTKAEPFRVCWQFAPGTHLQLEPNNDRFFAGERQGVRFTAGFDAAWHQVRLYPETRASVGHPAQGDLAGLCSRAFRRIEAGPFILLEARGQNPCLYRTTFLACASR